MTTRKRAKAARQGANDDNDELTGLEAEPAGDIAQPEIDREVPAEQPPAEQEPAAAPAITVVQTDAAEFNKLITQQLAMARQILDQAARPPTIEIVRQEATKIPKYSELVGMREYLAMFRSVSTEKQWSDREAAVQLCTHLTGPAQAAAFRLAELGFDHMEKQLLRQYTLDPADARDKLKHFKKTKEMSFRQMADTISDLVKAANANKPHITATDLTDQEITAFAEALKCTGIQMHMRQTPPSCLTEAVIMAEAYAGMDERNNRDKRTVLREVTFQDDVEEDMTELTEKMAQFDAKIDQVGAMLRKFSESTAEKPVECYICQGEHYASGCPNRPARPPTSHRNDKRKRDNREKDNSRRSNNKQQKSGNE